MSAPVWPPSLPPKLLQAGYKESAPETALRTKMDAGPAKVRQRFSAAVRPISGRMLLTSEQQLEAFERFFLVDCAGGALQFQWAHPRTGAPVNMRFTKAPDYVALAPGLVELTLALEIMP
jgi:hypothetical protein